MHCPGIPGISRQAGLGLNVVDLRQPEATQIAGAVANPRDGEVVRAASRGCQAGLKSSGTLPPFSASFWTTCLCSQTFMVAESSLSPV